MGFNETHQAQVKKKKRMRVMMNQVQAIKNIQGPCYTITARLPSMYMSFGYKEISIAPQCPLCT